MEVENTSRYKDRPKNPKRRDQMEPEHESAFGTFGVPNGTLKVPNCHHVGFGLTTFE